MNQKLNFMVADNTRIFANGENEFRIRKGIWNFEEATLHLESLNDNVKKILSDIFYQLGDGKEVDLEFVLDAENLNEDEKNQVKDLLLALQAQNYLMYAVDNKTKLLIHELIGGTVIRQFTAEVGPLKPVLFFADSQYTKDISQITAKEIGLPMTIMTEKEFEDLAAADLTTKFDAVQTNRQMEEFQKFIQPYCCIVGSLEKPRITFLRNLNRILIKLSKPLSLCMMDGPFMTLFTIKPLETACFECFENRLLARLEDMAVYRTFVANTRNKPTFKEKTILSPLLQPLTSAALMEGFLLSSIERAKLAGRVLNIYLPILEIQFQDLLRVPFCPACGFIAESQMEEMYTSSKKIVNKLIDKVLIKN